MSQLVAIHSLRLAPGELAEEVRRRFGQPLRREGDFARLCLAGLAAGLAEAGVACQGRRNGLIYGSGAGASQETQRVLAEVAQERSLPMPFDFIASQPGVAAAHAARLPGSITGATCMLSTGALWEQMLTLSVLWLASGRYEQVLCGWVEPAQFGARPLHCSDWLLLAAAQCSGPVLAQLELAAPVPVVPQLADEAAFLPTLDAWLKAGAQTELAAPACGRVRWRRVEPTFPPPPSGGRG
ncbi:hypothetical protein BURK2_00747 [Burkholderiales bacterium]